MRTTLSAQSLRVPLVRMLSRDGDKARVRALVRVALKSLDIEPRNYARAVFGPEETWLHPVKPFSEFWLLDPRQPALALQYILDTGIPSLPMEAPAFIPKIIETLFFRPTEVIPARRAPSRFSEEAWFFINGVMTNADVARLNARCLRRLFGRPLTIIQNSTNGLLVDLVQCAIGKEWDVMTEPVPKALHAVLQALRDESKTNVVIIAHSQGTIITRDVLDVLKDLVKKGTTGLSRDMWSSATSRYNEAVKAALALLQGSLRARDLMKARSCGLTPFESLPPLTLAELNKLQIYAFANCSSRMTYLSADRAIPFIESFGNSNDIVARLGMFSPDRAIKIDGPMWEREDAWGHQLNAHYLIPILEAFTGNTSGPGPGAAPFVPYPPRRGHPARPRLYDYLERPPAKKARLHSGDRTPPSSPVD